MCGEIPVALVVAAARTGLTASKICAAFEGRLARYKHPRAVVFVPALPRNAMGKVLKHEVRDALKAGAIQLPEKN